MKTKLHLPLIIHHSLLCILFLALLAASPRASAQSLWGNALSFDGEDDYVQAGAVPLANSSFTLEAWARRHSAAGVDFILGQGGLGNSHCLGFGYFNSQFVLVFYGDDLWTTNTYTDTDWHHWAGTYNASSRARYLYRDGVLVAADTASTNYQGSGPLTVGRVPWSPETEFDGDIDEVRIWSVARSQADIAAHIGHPLNGNEPNLLAYWKFDEGSGTDAVDATGRGYDGMLVNGPQWVVSSLPWGNALAFNGTNQYMALPTGTWFSNDLTIEAWVYEQSYNTYSRVADFGNGQYADNVVLALSYGTTGQPCFEVDTSGTAHDLVASEAIPTGQWVHLAATLQGSNATIYVNGMVVAATNNVTPPNAVNRTNNYVGRSNWATNSYANAIFDELRIWSVARTASQIQEGMCHPLSGTESNLVACYRFDSVSGTNAFDATPNHLDGTLVNGPVWTNSTIPSFINVTPWVAPGLPGVEIGSAAWGDYDNDGRLDFLLTGTGPDAGSDSVMAQLWRNTGSGFTNATATVTHGLPGVFVGSVAWGDYNNDGRLDFLLTGYGNAPKAQVWQNTGNGFTNVTATVAPELPGVAFSSVAWGDYDNDGRLDFLLTGSSASGGTAQLWRNTGSGFTNVTATVAPGLPGVYNGSVAWGDYDNDGRLDFLLTGTTNGSASGLIAQVWRNTGSGFTNVTATVAPGLPGVYYSSVAWGDYDNDGRLDFLLTGTTNGFASGLIAQVWRNTGNGFSNVTATVAPELPGVAFSSVAWGDYDNDGRLDLLLTGYSAPGPIAQVWRNTGSGFSNMTAAVAPGLPGVAYGSVAWGDYDNDGRLDFLLTGQDASGNPIAQVWRNISWTANTAPAPPTNLAVTATNSALAFSWNLASDAQTPAPGLTYNLRVGTTPGGSDIVSPQAGTDGTRRLPASGSAHQAVCVPLAYPPTTGRFYWSIQAVDAAFAGSPFAAERSFTLWPVLAPDSGPVPGDLNADGVVDAADLAILLARLNGNGSVDASEFASVLPRLNGNGSVSQDELDMVLASYYPFVPLCLTNTWGLGGKSVSFALPNSAAGAFSVLVSTNLVNWAYLGPALPRYGFTDTNASAATKRFYRLSWP